MTLNFDILFTVFFRHTYFSNSKLESLSVSPAKESMQTLNNNGLLFKSFKDGFRILFETTLAGRKRERSEILGKGLALRFILGLNDSHFYNYTSVVTDNIKDYIFYFSNASLNDPANSREGILHHHEFVSKEDLLSLESVGDNFFVKPFGVLDVELSSPLMAENTIFFDKKTSYWQYIVVGDHLKSLANLAIINADSQVVFEGPEKISLPDKREALLFTSLSQIGSAEKPDGLFQLVENYEPDSGKHKVVMRALPVPDVKSISSGTGKSSAEKTTNYSEIFIY